MRIPYETTGAVGRQYIALNPEIVAAILLTLRHGWDEARIDQEIAALGEVEITERLRDGMRAVLEPARLPWARSLIVALGMESRSTPQAIPPDGRTDIPIYVIEVFLRFSEHDPHAIIECKRLDGADAHLCREYVVEGIDRFRSGKYSENHATGFMAGYVIRGNAENASDGVNAYLERSRRSEEWLKNSTHVEDPVFRESRHNRAVERPAIALHHALLEVNRALL